MQVVLWRPLLAEFNTHRVFSRNSASSRAISITKQIDRLTNDPAYPIAWLCEQPGMQGGAELQGFDLELAMQLYQNLHDTSLGMIEQYLNDVALAYPGIDAKELKSHTLHKSLLARPMETWMWQTIVVTATEWEGFFRQRATEFSQGAQAEFRATADAMLVALRESTPVELDYGQWHLPYILQADRDWAAEKEDPDGSVKNLSTARCAGVSYLSQDGVRDPENDLRIYGNLVSADPKHASPFEHPCTPATAGEIEAGNVAGNLHGFHQYRHSIVPHVYDADLTQKGI